MSAPRAAGDLEIELESDEETYARRARILVGVFVTVCCLGFWFACQSKPKVWRLADGREIRVLNWDRHARIELSAGGVPTRTSYDFWVRYLSSTRDPDSMALEGRGLAPLLFPIADTLGLSAIHLDPTYRLNSSAFVTKTFSIGLVYERGADGRWRETDSLRGPPDP